MRQLEAQGEKMLSYLSLSGEDPANPALQSFAGVGLLRGEFIFRCRGQPVDHPAAMQALGDYLERTCQAHAKKPVWYRLCDLWSDEADALSQSRSLPAESNPMLGQRGIRRLLAHPDLLRLELNQVARAAGKHKNLHIMAPFVRDSQELTRLLPFIESCGFSNKLGTMVEIPSAIFEVESFISYGVSNILIGLNDLSCLTLGQERGSHEAKLHPSVWKLIAEVQHTSVGHCDWGIGGSLTPPMIEMARKAGADYVTMHYADLPLLTDIPADSLPDLNFVRDVKQKTRSMKQQLQDVRHQR
jgi:phosphoenolpyruvate-protein kinase (PTS system EI component)